MALNTFTFGTMSSTLGKHWRQAWTKRASYHPLSFRFKDNPVIAQAFATIPSVNMWDDHVSDGMDGSNTKMTHSWRLLP